MARKHTEGFPPIRLTPEELRRYRTAYETERARKERDGMPGPTWASWVRNALNAYIKAEERRTKR